MFHSRGRLPELGHRVASAGVEQELAVAVVRREVRVEVVRTEEVVEAGEASDLVAGERLVAGEAELGLAYGVPLLLRDREQRDRLAVTATQVFQDCPELGVEEGVRTSGAREQVHQELVHGQAVLDLEDLVAQELSHHGLGQVCDRVQEALGQADHVDLDTEVGRTVAVVAVLVVGLPLAVGRDQRGEGRVVLEVEVGERLQHDRRVGGVEARQHLERAHGGLDGEVEHRTQRERGGSVEVRVEGRHLSL